MCVISLCTCGALDTWSRGRSTAALCVPAWLPVLLKTHALPYPANNVNTSRSPNGHWWTVGLTACLVAAVLWGLHTWLRSFIDVGVAGLITLIAFFLAALVIENIRPLSNYRTGLRFGIALGLGLGWLAVFAFQRAA